MGDMKRSRKCVSLLSIIAVVGLCLAGCEQGGDETPQASPSAVSPGGASSPNPRGASNPDANIQPSLNSQAEGDPHTYGDTAENSHRRQEDAPSQSNGGSNHIPNPDKIGGYCGTTYDGDKIEAGAHTSCGFAGAHTSCGFAGAHTSCGFAGAIFTSAMQQTYHKWTPDPTVTSILRADFTLQSPTTGKAYTVIAV